MSKKREKFERILKNPFSDNFLPTWELWKQYKKEEFKFSYKSIITEQAAIDHLADLSKKNEELALLIVKQSISQGWKGLFDLKNNFSNGKTTTSTASSRFNPGAAAADRADVNGTNYHLERT